jgi:hypothetical protein
MAGVELLRTVHCVRCLVYRTFIVVPFTEIRICYFTSHSTVTKLKFISCSCKQKDFFFVLAEDHFVLSLRRSNNSL